MSMRIYKLSLYILISPLLLSCSNIGNTLDTGYSTDSENRLENVVTLFEPNLISTRHNERDIAISPDGQQIYFTRVAPKNRFSVILFVEKKSGNFTKPVIASFSGRYSDLEPAFSPDGQRLYFSSNRPLSGSGEPKDFDIWFVEKTKQGWTDAKNVGAPVNSDLNEYYPSITNNGDIYFTGLFDNEISGENIYKSAFKDGLFQQPQVINEQASQTHNEFNAFIAPDESYIIFSSDRKQQRGDYADLFISFNTDQQWSEAVNLGEAVNTSQLDYCPFVFERNGERILFFTRTDLAIDDHYQIPLNTKEFELVLDSIQNGSGNIYSMDFNALLDSLNNGPE